MKDRIRQIMEAQHMNQQSFAAATGINTATLSSIFSGRTNPSTKIVESIHNKFPNVRTDWLMWGTGGMFEMSGDGDDGFGHENGGSGSYPSGGSLEGSGQPSLFGSGDSYGSSASGSGTMAPGSPSVATTGGTSAGNVGPSVGGSGGSSSSPSSQRDLFGSANVADRNRHGNGSQQRQPQQNGGRMGQSFNPQVTQIQAVAPIHQRKITEIRVYYDDQTWESFTPKK